MQHRQAVASPDPRGWGGQRLGGPQRGPGAEPRWGSEPPEADPYTRFIVAKSRYFPYNLRNSTSMEVFRVFHEWFTEAD